MSPTGASDVTTARLKRTRALGASSPRADIDNTVPPSAKKTVLPSTSRLETRWARAATTLAPSPATARTMAERPFSSSTKSTALKPPLSSRAENGPVTTGAKPDCTAASLGASSSFAVASVGTAAWSTGASVSSKAGRTDTGTGAVASERPAGCRREYSDNPMESNTSTTPATRKRIGGGYHRRAPIDPPSSTGDQARGELAERAQSA